MSGESAVQSGRLGRSSALFATIFVLAAALAASIAWLASYGAQIQGDIQGPLRLIITGLIVDAGLIAILAVLVGRRMLTVFRSREAGSRMHLRYMTLFALAAAIPAIVGAFSFVLLIRGVDVWFSSRVSAMMDSSAEIAKYVYTGELNRLEAAIDETSTYMDRSISGLRSRETFEEKVLKPLLGPNGYISIRVIDAQGRLLAEAKAEQAGEYRPPASKKFVDADVAVSAQCRSAAPPADCSLPYDINDQTDIATVLFPLSGSNHPYVLFEAPLQSGLFAKLSTASDAITQFRAFSQNQGAVRGILFGVYVEVMLLMLLGAVWLGMAVASNISEPVSWLIEAANRVAIGDLSARVPSALAVDEIGMLSHSFNKMTDDLERQTAALVAAGKEADNRRTFIETVLSGVSAGVIGLDASGRISAFNNQALRLLDMRAEDARGKSLAEVAPELEEVAARAAETGAGAEAELNILRGNLVRRLRVRAGGDAHDGLVLTFDDMTRLVAAQRNAAWRDVARRIAHEIKNPLTPIQLSAERLRRKYRQEVISDVETFDRCTETIIRQVSDIGRMVDEFSSFARMPAPRIASCDGVELLREAVFARRVAHPDIDITLTDEMQGDPVIQCDERMIAQALTNILKNAAEAVQARLHAEPEPAGRITATIRRGGDLVQFEIEDNGVGLPEEGRDRLIEPYVTTREKGTGLGLAIVSRILEDHGGSLILGDAEHGRGARLVLTLPQDELRKTPGAKPEQHIEQV